MVKKQGHIPVAVRGGMGDPLDVAELNGLRRHLKRDDVRKVLIGHGLQNGVFASEQGSVTSGRAPQRDAFFTGNQDQIVRAGVQVGEVVDIGAQFRPPPASTAMALFTMPALMGQEVSGRPGHDPRPGGIGQEFPAGEHWAGKRQGRFAQVVGRVDWKIPLLPGGVIWGLLFSLSHRVPPCCASAFQAQFVAQKIKKIEGWVRN